MKKVFQLQGLAGEPKYQTYCWKELKAVGSVLKDASKKLKDAMASASIDRNSLQTADLMLETASIAK